MLTLPGHPFGYANEYQKKLRSKLNRYTIRYNSPRSVVSLVSG